MIRAGELRHRVTIQREVTATSIDPSDDSATPGDDVALPIGAPEIGNGLQDRVAGYELQWETVATVWARVRPLSTRERLFAGRIEESVTHEVQIRDRPDLGPGLRLLFKGRVLTVRGLPRRHNEIRELMILLAEEGVAS